MGIDKGALSPCQSKLPRSSAEGERKALGACRKAQEKFHQPKKHYIYKTQ